MAAPTRISASLNSPRLIGAHPRVPTSPEALVADALAVAGAGAVAVHLYAISADGGASLDPLVVDETVRAIRKIGGSLAISVGTDLFAGSDDHVDADLVRQWTEPTFAAVRLSDPSHYDLMEAALDAGLGLEVAVSTPADVQRLTRTGLIDEVTQVVIAPGREEAVGSDDVVMTRVLEQALSAAAVRAPRVHQGYAATWDIVRAAIARGRDIRVGLPDTRITPDGRPAASNAALVRAARKLVELP